ncbi:hypothetical protein, partial [Carboxylicivirga linearis]
MHRKPTIYLNEFSHQTTPLIKLFFYSNSTIEQIIGKLDYVHYSHQYKCYYIRNKTEYKQKLFQD